MESKTKFVGFITDPADPITLLLYAAVFVLAIVWMIKGI
jgi:hypothetical protein